MRTFVDLDILLVAHTGDEPDFLVWESLPALLEHVGVADVEGVEDAVRVDPDGFILALFTHFNGIIIYVCRVA